MYATTTVAHGELTDGRPVEDAVRTHNNQVHAHLRDCYLVFTPTEAQALGLALLDAASNARVTAAAQELEGEQS